MSYDNQNNKQSTSNGNLKGGESNSRDVNRTAEDPRNTGGDNPHRQEHIVGSEAVQAVPLEIKVFNGSFDKAMRAFRSLVQKERVLSTYQEKGSYEKPSDKKRRKKQEAIRKSKDPSRGER
jgi:ribosomal protein S21